MNNEIRFMKYYVTNGVTKAKVSYSHTVLMSGVHCVTLYAKDYSDNLLDIFGAEYVNRTDIMTDYFEKGKVRIMFDSPLYPRALWRCPSFQTA